MKKMTYAEFQYKKALAVLRERRRLERRSDHYQYLTELMNEEIEKVYIRAAESSLRARHTATYEERPIYHRSANCGKIWAKLREWRKRENIEPSYPMDYI